MTIECEEYWKNREVTDHYLGAGEVPVLRVAGLLQPESVLEFGCGAGRNLAAIKEAFPKMKLVGQDFNKQMIEKGRIAFPHLNLLNSGIETDVGNYDLIYTVSVLCHMTDPKPTIAKLFQRVYKHLVLVEPWIVDFEGSVYPDWCDEQFSFSWDYNRILKELGIPVLERSRTPLPGRSKLSECYYTWICKKEEDNE